MSDDEAVPPRRLSLGNAGGSGPQPLRALSDDEGSLVAVPRGAHYKRKGPLVAMPGGEACKSKRAAVVPGPLPGKRGFVEVCSGSETFTSVWRDAGHAVFPVDIKTGGQSHDLATDAGAQLVCDAVARLTRDAGSPPVVHFAPPCSTYSCARRPRIRSADHPRGLPRDQLTVDQKALLKYANKVTATVFKLMEGLAADGVPHCFEQPASSSHTAGRATVTLPGGRWPRCWACRRRVPTAVGRTCTACGVLVHRHCPCPCDLEDFPGSDTGEGGGKRQQGADGAGAAVKAEEGPCGGE